MRNNKTNTLPCLILCLVSFVMLLTSSTACSRSPKNGDFTAKDGSAASVGLVPVSSDQSGDGLGAVKANRPYTFALTVEVDSFTDQIIQSIQAACDFHQAKLLVETAGRHPGEQVDQIKSFIRQDVDAIMVLIGSHENANDLIEAAGNTPLIFVNRNPQVSQSKEGSFVYVGSDESTAGRLQAEYLQDYAARRQLKEIRYFYLQGNTDLRNSRLRYESFVQTLKQGPLQCVQLDMEQAFWSRSQAQNLTQIFLGKDLGCNAIICGNDEMALGAIDALKGAGRLAVKDIVVLGIDGTEAAKRAVADGDLQFTVHQDARAQGASAVRAAVLLANHKQVPATVNILFKGMALEDLTIED